MCGGSWGSDDGGVYFMFTGAARRNSHGPSSQNNYIGVRPIRRAPCTEKETIARQKKDKKEKG